MTRVLLLMFSIITITGFSGSQNLDPAPLPGLTCNVTKQSDRSIRYQTFGKPSSTGSNFSWEKKNGIVIVDKNRNYNKHVVKTLMNDSVELYACEDFLRYNLHYENNGISSMLTATCKVNCTRLMTDDSPQVDVNSTLMNDDSPQVDGGIVGIVIGIIVFLASIVFAGLIFRFVLKRILKQIC